MNPIRKILHLDLDAFFCAVEELHNPALCGLPFAVGGRPDQRGVVASCSYPARAKGVRSAMPMGRALRLCPGLIVVPARHGAYGEMSKQVMARLHARTPLVEQVSIDEAYLDVTALPAPAEEVARDLQTQIRNELRLPCSLGVATNKLVAKVANNVGKDAARVQQHVVGPPNAITVVPPGQEAAFLAPLSCAELWGVGPRTAERLALLGIQTIGQLATRPEAELVRLFGKSGADMRRHARGLDDAPIVTERERKSISQETTFLRDISDEAALRKVLFDQARDVALSLKRSDLAGATVKLKLRWSDFSTITRQSTLEEPTQEAQPIFQAALALLQKAWDGRPIRLIGVGVSRLAPPAAQPTLFDQPDPRLQKLDDTLARLRARYGDGVIRSAREDLLAGEE
jgi:DNA polymerase-4